MHLQNESGPRMFHPKPVSKPILSKVIRAIRLLTSILWAWVLGHKISKRVRPKKFHPKPVSKPTPSKAIKAIRLLTSILWAWVLGQFFSKRVRPKNGSPQTCQRTNPIQNCKGHKAPIPYLMGVGAGPQIFKTTQAQTCFTPNLSANQPYQKQ